MDNYKSLLSVFPEPYLLVSNKSGKFFVHAENNGIINALGESQHLDKPMPVFEVIRKGYGDFNTWQSNDMDRYLQSIIDKQKPGFSKIIKCQKKSGPEFRYIQFSGIPVSVDRGSEAQVFFDHS